jgi:hypothetical protein
MRPINSNQVQISQLKQHQNQLKSAPSSGIHQLIKVREASTQTHKSNNQSHNINQATMNRQGWSYQYS